MLNRTLTDDDVAALRTRTPGTAHVTHLNNAACSLPTIGVLDTVIGYLHREAMIGGYEAAAEVEQQLSAVYASIAALLGAQATEIALVENATVAWDMAFHSIPFAEGDRILTVQSEYASNYIAYLLVAERHGVQVDVVPDDSHGQADLEALEAMMDDRVRLVSVTHVPTNGGLVNPVSAIGAIAKRAGALFLVDACQSVGQLDFTVDSIRCDLLSFTGRKYVRGPRGTGALYVRSAVLDQLRPPFLDLHSATWTSPTTYEMVPDARRFENWESNIANKLGLGVAVDEALAIGLPAIEGRIIEVAARLRTMLRNVPGVMLHDQGERQCGIVTFTVDGHDPADLVATLRAQTINVSVTRRSGTLLDMSHRNLDALVRASVHYFNTDDELDRLCSAVGALG